MSSRDRPRDDDLEERLDELEAILGELRADLQREQRSRRGLPRPPRISELLRFTEQYTIPALIALLETTIKSLELLRGTLKLADPERGLDVDSEADATRDRLAGVRDGASAGLARSLSELRTALSEADLPEEAASRSLIQDARDLTAEIEARIEESRREADVGRRRTSGSAGGIDERDEGTDGREWDRGRNEAERDGRSDDAVHIDVSDPSDVTADNEADDDENDDHGTEVDRDRTPEVDVESELQSIKRTLEEPDDPESATPDEGTDDGSDDRGTANGERDTDEDATDTDRDDADER